MQTASQHSHTALSSTKLGIAVSIVLVVAKGLAGHYGHSYALVADATETAADVLSSFLLLLALRVALKPADEDHPYGHGKAEPMAAILVAISMILAAAWIAWHAVERIRIPHEMPLPFTLWVLLAVMAVKYWLYRRVLAVGLRLKSQAVIADARHHLSDALISVAAFFGISIALLLGPGNEAADDWAALLAAMVIVYNAIAILRPAAAEIMDAAPPPEMVEKIRQLARKVPKVKDVEKCFLRKMGFEYFADLHVMVDADLSVAEGHTIAHAVKDYLKEHAKVADVLVHIEPFYGKDLL